MHFHTSTLLVERSFISNGNPDELYGSADTIIDRNDSRIFVSNFSKNPITVPAGQVLGIARNPSSWLDNENKFSELHKKDAESRARLVQTLIEGQPVVQEPYIQSDPSVHTSKCQLQEVVDPLRLRYSGEDPLSEPPVEGGPKTAEVPEEAVPENRLLQELDISTNPSREQILAIQRILVKHKEVFGLDGRLGNYAEEVTISLVPDTKPISIPPFHASPANREVIDKQMDSWLNLGVIELSQSLWGASVFIAYRNGKLCMVIDLR